VRGSFSSTRLALAFGGAGAGETPTKRDGKFKVALLTSGRQRLSANAQLQMDSLCKDMTVWHWWSSVLWTTLRS